MLELPKEFYSEYNLSSHPVVFNDEVAVKTTLVGARKIFDKENIVCISKIMLGEDFSIYQKKIPGVL